ncbi:MAG: HEAT repeat domain-containing protein [Planctomycetota bacterium]|nr:HEAT repeat domain-containing protein [Planctomycetota bacterium]
MNPLHAFALAPLWIAPTQGIVEPPASGIAVSNFDDARDIKSRDAEVRLAAVLRIAATNNDDTGKLLAKALKDDDWEIVTIAATALGEIGREKSLKNLAKLAWEGPTLGVRTAAALAAGKIDSEAALKELAKKLSGDRAVKTSAAYALVAMAADQPKSPKALAKLLVAKDTLTRAAAARALVLCATSEREELAAELLASPHQAVVAATLDAMVDDPQAGLTGPIEALLQNAALSDVIERRAIAALVANLGAESDTKAGSLRAIQGLSMVANGPVSSRAPRLLEECLDAKALDAGDAADALKASLASSDVSTRAAAARALGFGSKDACLPIARKLGESDSSGRVRRAAVTASLTLEPVEDDDQRAWLVGRLSADGSAAIREDIAVALGQEGLDDVQGPLIQALGDKAWGVAACAAVSLGRTRAESCIDELAALSRREDSWRMRGAAAVGLCHAMHKRAIPPLIELLADPEPLVARTAFGFLKSIAKGPAIGPDIELWRAWWAENEKRIHLETPKEANARREKYGYSESPDEIYAGLDVMVFESRGDHIETVLDFIGISHRKTTSNRVAEGALDASGVFVSNCTGEMQVGDVERLQWFVKCGGYLFGSCWAINETIERVAPGAIRKFFTSSEVMDKVTASACDPGNGYLKGVFPAGVVPIYSLVGAHLIEVMEPERVEVLVDSAECAERWGEGNLTAWFREGHGRILDSVNHFEAQGLSEATGLKTDEDRMAYAIDHMGISFAKIRETRDEKWWSGNMKAAEHIRDLSVFNLLTNFVRARRIDGY